ncbi:hypothetical protein M3Y96_00660300 [Aphelenchoides besseyi]|nr:hypothetical protein M3Y96_00660300 [Aphelenchoides besseyi]
MQFLCYFISFVVFNCATGLRVERSDQNNFVEICNATWSSVDALVKCDGGEKCTDGFECINKFCCPTKKHVCTSPVDSGHEVADFEHSGKFAYSAELKNCIKFSWFGHGGNFNRFDKYLSCTRFCSDCSSPKDSGAACSENAGSRMFYYDPRMGVCQPFQYNGCGGNENRYSSAAECRETCKKSSDTPRPSKTGHDQWVHAEKCNATHLIPNGNYIDCRKGRSKCPDNHKCKNGVCCPKKEYVCSLRDDTGTFADGIEDKPRFAWSDEINSCLRFSYYGAKGNYNNFRSFQSCVKYCKKN